MQAVASVERPLTPWAKTGLVISTGAVIFLFYMFTLLAALFLLVLLSFELLLVLAGARFGLATFMARIMTAHLDVVVILFRSLWLPSERAVYRIPLQSSEAPELFRMLESLSQRFKVRPPDEVQLEMSVNAWVNLKGLRTGAGKTRLGFGYDLMAGLNTSEIESVFAHELAHARRVQRGFSRFSHAALNRCARLVGALAAHVQAARNANSSRALASGVLSISDAIIRVFARLVAAYSRQDEFEADLGAAEICGSRVFRSALQKLQPLAEASNRVPWRERVAQLQSGGGYSLWFAQQLTTHLASTEPQNETVFDKYSTHPTLGDRLAALPPENETSANDAPALSLLATPDATAEKLVAEIHRVAAIEENRDSKALSKWRRRESRRGGHVTALQFVGITIFIIAVITLILAFFAGSDGFLMGLGSLVGFGLGTLIYQKCGYKDRRTFPIPDFDEMVRATRRPIAYDQQEALEKEFDKIASAERRKKRKLKLLLDQAYDALAKCDYLRAHVASRFCFKFEKKSVEAHLAFAVAAAGVRQFNESSNALRYVHHHTGFRSSSTAWAAAWALTQLGDWAHAEALVDGLLKKDPHQKTLLSILAVARSRRGKSNSAIAAAREVCTPTPPSVEHARLLASLLLDAGMLREASARLMPLEATAQTDPDLQLQMVRLKLLTRDFESADRWNVLLLKSDPAPRRTLQLAWNYQQARRFDRAEEYFSNVLNQGYCTEAHIGLGQIEAERRNKSRARAHFLSSLNLKTTLANDAVGPLQIFNNIVMNLCALEESALCAAWNATLPSTGKINQAIANTIYFVFAPSQEKAQEHLTVILKAMDPDIQPADLSWEKAPQDQQPVRPVRPGVQHLFARR